ncbi:MAG: thermonuclease family protein [Pirellulales bacterium]
MNRLPRRYWRDHRGLALWLACGVVVLWRFLAINSAQVGPELLEEGLHEVRRVIDGDTLVLTSGGRLRLQGVDTPETVAENRPVESWGPEASRFTKDFVKRAGGKVRLTFSLERKDRHDRFLAFVWDGDVMLNEELVRAGLAHARLDYRYSGPMKRRLAAAQDEAQTAGRGIWSTSASALTDL